MVNGDSKAFANIENKYECIWGFMVTVKWVLNGDNPLLN